MLGITAKFYLKLKNLRARNIKDLRKNRIHPSTVEEIEAHSVYVICPKYIKQQNQDHPVDLIFPLNHD